MTVVTTVTAETSSAAVTAAGSAISFDAVQLRYPGAETAVLNGIELEIPRAEFCVILGRSGTGKSTLLRCINGFVQPQGGTVTVNGERVAAGSAALKRVRGSTAFIFQGYNLVHRLTVMQNVLCGMLRSLPRYRALLGIFTRAERERAFELLELVGLAEQAGKRADQLSGGQKQRVGIARALAQRPEIILADEPVASLDPVTSREILTLLRQINERDGITVVVSLHQIEYAREFGERVIALQGGRVVVDTDGAHLDDAQIARIYGGAAETSEAMETPAAAEAAA